MKTFWAIKRPMDEVETTSSTSETDKTSENKMPISSAPKEEPKILLFLDTNIFAFYAIDLIEKYVKAIYAREGTTKLPFIVFRELDDFKGNRKSTQEGEIMRYIGRKSLGLISTYLNKGIEVSKDNEFAPITQVKPTKDDYVAACVEFFAAKHKDDSNTKIVMLTRDEGVSIRIRSLCSSYPNVECYRSFDELQEKYFQPSEVKTEALPRPGQKRF